MYGFDKTACSVSVCFDSRCDRDFLEIFIFIIYKGSEIYAHSVCGLQDWERILAVTIRDCSGTYIPIASQRCTAPWVVAASLQPSSYLKDSHDCVICKWGLSRHGNIGWFNGFPISSSIAYDGGLPHFPLCSLI